MKKMIAISLILTVFMGISLYSQASQADIQKKMDNARDAIKNGKNNVALKLFEDVLVSQPTFAEAHFNIGILLREGKKFQDAISHFKEAVKLKKGFTVAIKALGETLYALKEFEDAGSYFQMYLDILIENNKSLSKVELEIIKVLGNCRRGLKQTDEANSFYAKYIDLKSKNKLLVKNDAKLCSALGAYYYGKKDMANAVKFYKLVITNDPLCGPEVYMYLGNSYFYAKDLKSAETVFALYLKRFPNAKDATKIRAFKETIEKSMAGAE
ncbi:MAG: tetratricopeptide repeat protein [bacterium]|nr:tetratricopeptide repeat protein [bacterium]